MEALRKVKEKGKKVFSRPPCISRSGGRVGEQAIPSKLWTERDFRPAHDQEADEMTINFSRAEGSDCRRAKGSCICTTVNTKCVNCQSYNAKTACFGFHSGTKACEQSIGSGKNFPLCHQLEGNNRGPMGPLYGAGLPHSFQGGTSSSARSSTMPVFRGSDEAFARGGIFLAGEGSSGDSGACCLERRVLLDPLPGTQDRRSDKAHHKPKSAELLVHPQHFKMEGIHTLREIVVQDKWLAKLDLKDAYFTVPIHWDHWKFLRFMVDQVRYQSTYLVLPGLLPRC